jgi:hypothetical protein
MPTTSLLSQNSIGTLIALRQLLLCRLNLSTQHSLIAAPNHLCPIRTRCFALSIHNQLLDKLIGMLAHSSTQNQTLS